MAGIGSNDECDFGSEDGRAVSGVFSSAWLA